METKDILYEHVSKNDTVGALEIINKYYIDIRNNQNLWDMATVLAYKAIDHNNIDILNLLLIIIHNNTSGFDDDMDDCAELLDTVISRNDYNLINIIDHIIHFWIPDMSGTYQSYESHVQHMLSTALDLAIHINDINICIFKHIVSFNPIVKSSNILDAIKGARSCILEELLKSDNIIMNGEINDFFDHAISICSTRKHALLVLNFSKDKVDSTFYNIIVEAAKDNLNVGNEEDI